MRAISPASARAGDLTLQPYVYRTDSLYGPADVRPHHRVPTALGRLLVPESRHEPGSNLIEIAFVRFPSTAQRPGPPVNAAMRAFLSGAPVTTTEASIPFTFAPVPPVVE
jgi:hypothetical protein